MIEQGGRRGFEAGVAIKRPEWGGFYVRAGELSSSPTARGGRTFSAGVDAGTIPTILVVGSSVVAAALVLSGGLVGPGG